jgi:glycosyltransferase involved in cell wall biosynthesis
MDTTHDAAQRQHCRGEGDSPIFVDTKIGTVPWEAALAEKDRQWERQLAQQKKAYDALTAEFDRVLNSRGFRMLERLRRVRAWLPWRGPTALSRCGVWPTLGAWLAPGGSLLNRCVRGAAKTLRRLRCRVAHPPGIGLDQVLRETQNRKGIVVYPPFIDWSWMRQRPHQLMAQFAEAGYLALFCSPKARTDWFRGFSRLADNLYLCDAIEPLYALPDPIVLTSWTGHWETIKGFRSPLVIYDYLDDLSVGAQGGVVSGRKLELHRKMVSRADIVLATARRLHDEVAQVRPDALFCPNGADYEHFHLTSAPPMPLDIADAVAAGRPIIGYYGALAHWFDYDLVARAATAHRDFEFVLIGPNLDGSLARQPLVRLPNVRWLGQKRYEELPAYLHYFTVATIPFVLNDITRATSPVKLFEYMAGGRPIVTTDMPECRGYPCVIVARDPPEYAAMLAEAVGRGAWESYRQSLDREARNNTWQTRVEQILDRMHQTAAGSRRRSA